MRGKKRKDVRKAEKFTGREEPLPGAWTSLNNARLERVEETLGEVMQRLYGGSTQEKMPQASAPKRAGLQASIGGSNEMAAPTPSNMLQQEIHTARHLVARLVELFQRIRNFNEDRMGVRPQEHPPEASTPEPASQMAKLSNANAQAHNLLGRLEDEVSRLYDL